MAALEKPAGIFNTTPAKQPIMLASGAWQRLVLCGEPAWQQTAGRTAFVDARRGVWKGWRGSGVTWERGGDGPYASFRCVTLLFEGKKGMTT